MNQSLADFYDEAVAQLGAHDVRPHPEPIFYLGALAAVRLINRGTSPAELIAEIDARCTIEEAR